MSSCENAEIRQRHGLRRPWEDAGRYQNDAPMSLGMPRTADGCQELGRAWCGSLLRASEKPTLPTPQFLTSGLPNCETMNSCCVKLPSFVVTGDGSPRNLILLVP